MALRTPLSVTPHLYMGDSTGRPLDNGVVYFGEQDKDPEFYPITLYSDDALTLPLMQPVHTKGGYLYDKGDMVEPHAKEIIYSVKVLDSYGRKVFYKGAMMRNSWNDDVIEQINAAIVASADVARQVATDITNEAINNTAVEGGVLADTFVTVTANGVGAVARTQRDKNGEHVSVKDFGAKGDGSTDDTAAIKAAITYVAGKEGGVVFLPTGSYRTSSTIEIPAKVTLRGANRESSVLSGLTRDFVGVKLMALNSKVTELTVNAMGVGVEGGADARYCKLVDTIIKYCRIGILWTDGYINTIASNLVYFNDYGMVSLGQSYQLNIYDNVIDNNTGGLGVLLLGSAGVVIRDNTIEGNRVPATGHGIGLAVFNFPQRVIVDSNWFEVNGTSNLPNTSTPNEYSCDVLLGDGISPTAVELINNCIPEEYRSQCLDEVSSSGNIVLSGNFHYMSRYGIMMRLQSTALDVTIRDMTFNGSAAGHKLISIFNAGSGKSNGEIRVSGVFAQVLGGSNASLLGGIGGTPIHCNTETDYGLVTYNGNDLYTKKMTCSEFLALPNSSLTVGARPPSSGTASLKTISRAQLGTKGVTTGAEAGRLRAGDTVLAPTGSSYSLMMVGKPNSTFLPQRVEGVSSIAVTYKKRADIFTVVNNYPLSAEITLGAGTFYGYSFMTNADAAVHLKGVTRLELVDLQVESDVNRAAAAPTSTQISWSVGDIVYNSAPAVGGAYSWICTAAGAPGTWAVIATTA